MPSQYQQIKGERYERELLDIARQKARDGRGFLRELGQDVAERLWEAAMDGRGVTATERKTLEFIMEGGDGQFTVSAAGRAYLRRKLDQEPPVGGGGRPAAAERQPAAEPPGGRGMGSGGYYRRVQGMNYDRALLDSADRIVSRDGSITMREAIQLWADAHDGRGVTDCERRTLEYIAGAYPFEHGAALLLQSLARDAGLPPLDGGLGQGGKRGGALAVEAPPGGRRGAAAEAGGAAPRGRGAGPAALEGGGGAPRGRSRSRSPQRRGSTGQSSARSLLALATSWLPPLFRRADPAAGGGGAGAELARPGGGPAGSGGGCAAPGGASAGGGLEGILAPEVAMLLRDDADGAPQPEVTDVTEPVLDESVERKKAEAVREVARILSTRRPDDILGGGSKEERLREFRRLALLLHPDKPWASSSEPAVLAYRLTLAAKKKIR